MDSAARCVTAAALLGALAAASADQQKAAVPSTSPSPIKAITANDASPARTGAASALAVIELGKRDDSGLISAHVSNARLGALAAALEAKLGVEVSLENAELAGEPVANARFENQTLELSLGELLRGFSHMSFARPEGGPRVVKIYSVAQSAPAVAARPVSPPANRNDAEQAAGRADRYATLDDLDPLSDYQQAVADAQTDSAGMPGVEPDEYEQELRIEAEAEAAEALRTARTRRALDALKLDPASSTPRFKADAISELVDAQDPRATSALADAASDSSLSPPVRQHALEVLMNRASAVDYDSDQLIPLLETLAADKTFAVSTTAQRSLASVRRQQGK